jgi:hypothetical protein
LWVVRLSVARYSHGAFSLFSVTLESAINFSCSQTLLTCPYFEDPRSLGLCQIQTIFAQRSYYPDGRTYGSHRHHHQRKAEQNGCRQRLEGYLSCQQRLALAVA